MIHKYKKEKQNLYLLLSDIEKCFDNLWLRDCILELTRCGTPIEEAIFIFQMNKEVRATVKTPVQQGTLKRYNWRKSSGRELWVETNCA